LNKNTIIIVLGIIGLSLFIDKVVSDRREFIKDSTQQYQFSEKECENDKKYQEIMQTLDSIEHNLEKLKKGN